MRMENNSRPCHKFHQTWNQMTLNKIECLIKKFESELSVPNESWLRQIKPTSEFDQTDTGIELRRWNRAIPRNLVTDGGWRRLTRRRVAARDRRLPARGRRVELRTVAGKVGLWSPEWSEFDGQGGEINRGRFQLRFDRGQEMETGNRLQIEGWTWNGNRCS